MSTVILIVFIVVVVLWGKRRLDQKKQLAQEALVQGQAFLEKNQHEEGVITTESGLQYKILEKGEHSDHPTATSKVKVHYHGTLINGHVFDSSVDRGQPISFGLNQVIPGWTEGLQRMSVGDKFRLFIPADLAYGSGGAGKIPGNSTLIFDVELLGIE
ncbi:FKBP-type peptidyl-prolyl cis-trans isomerase [Endozoicomonas sp. 4G]|uniref:FKBP-type peptidyl-prolyl cis-trans isomerase n=1 Tax=Endozoicomonas sp. 4G TaxID=2872754 RepID=UPI0020785F4E|nr:FKBP-type peptidyl-prolyl cis-trans isomerase [Endozoicomonas sp. 4G]